ncbi:MAG: HDOD domain-containing protein [Kiritimatiellae bacterium]|nr:HDOD domain-containing protein [Kiritimatiellia bacterium]
MKTVCPKCRKACVLNDADLAPGKEVRFFCPNCKALLQITTPPPPAEQPPSAPAPEPEPCPEPAQPGRRRISSPASLPKMDPASVKEQILRTIRELPPMPRVMMKARHILEDPNADFGELARIIETDQAITTKILRYANSALYGMSTKITSVRHGTVVLGDKTLAEIITIASASGVLDRMLPGYGLSRGELWHHSLAVAGGAKAIARLRNRRLVDDAFTAGLIHDVGKLVLEPLVKRLKTGFATFLRDQGAMWLDAEKKLLSVDHAAIGAEICKEWKIPDVLTIPIRYHHTPSLSNGDLLSHFVHMADALAMQNGMGTGVDAERYRVDPAVSELLTLNAQETRSVVSELLDFVVKATQQTA